LHVPPQLQHHVRPVLQLAADVRDLVLWALGREVELAGRVRGELGFGFGIGVFGGVDVLIVVERGGERGEDGVPDYGL
jgi:hypothetical protein